MSGQHTPGEWEADKAEVWASHPTTGKQMLIAACGSDDNSFAVANARLIAAAPDLLKACEAALDYFTDTRHGCEWVEQSSEQSEADVLRTAIAKAKS